MRYPTGAILFLSATIAAVIAIGTWSFNEDLYVALCAGRDVVAGKLAQPDHWSFTTDGKVWVNQAWLSGLFYYISYRWLHDFGPILLKAILLLSCLVVLFIRCRGLGCSAELSFLALTIGTLAAGPIMSIRPENFGVLYLILFTTFLVAPRSWGKSRQIGCAVVFLVWCNSHGSFVFGFVLLGFKIALEAARVLLPRIAHDPARTETRSFTQSLLRLLSFGTSEPSRGLDRSSLEASGQGAPSSTVREAAYWALCLGLCFCMAAFANPYGLSNLVMPFTQTETASFTDKMPHWAPLIIDLSKLRFAGGRGMWVFLGCLMLTAVLGVAAAIRCIRKRPCVSENDGGTGIENDLPMEILTALLLTAVTFRFGRTAVFTSMIIVPLMGLLMQFRCDRARSRAMKSDRGLSRRLFGAAGPVSATLLLLTVTYVLADSTIIPLLPGNPLLRSNSAVARVLGPLTTNTADTVTFLRENRIGGRVFSNYMLADVLLLDVPGVQVFIDCRAQSIYTEAVLKDYERVLELDPLDDKSVAESLAVLNRRGVQVVVIGHYGIETYVHLAEALVKTKGWLPIYVDPYGHGFVFLRSDSQQLREFSRTGNLDHMKYPDSRSRVLSTAFLYLGRDGAIPSRVQTRLRETARTNPTALIYYATARGMGHVTGCLNQEIRSYLEAEESRLSLAAPADIGGAYWTLRSRLELLHMLDRDRKTCKRDTDPQAYAVKLWMVQQTIKTMRREFLPWGVDWSLP